MLDAELSTRKLAEMFFVTSGRIRELRRRGLVKLRRARLGGLDVFYGRPQHLVDVPLYRVGEVAKLAGVCTKTIRRAHDAGKIRLVRRHYRRLQEKPHLRATPRELVRFVFAREGAAARRRIPDLFDLAPALDGL